MDTMKLESVDVWFKLCDAVQVVNVTPQEAFTLMTMPSLVGLITNLVPQYELSEMPKE